MQMEIFTQHPQWKDVKKVCTRLHDQGFTAWLAGGCVRDGIMGVVPKDFDIATNARPKKIEGLFNKTVDVGKLFGVIKVIEPSGEIEVATFRKDGPYVDGRHPVSVELSTPEEDAKRRDFTINALFYDPFGDKIHDFVGGLNDINARLIRTVGLASDRFMEDKLRVLRAIRFVAQLDFSLDDPTLEAICQYTSAILSVSWERIHDELNKTLSSPRSDRGMKLLHETGLLHVLFPEINFPTGSDRLFFFPSNRKETGPLTQALIEEKSVLGWLTLFSLIPNVEEHEKIFKRLRFSNDFSGLIRNTLEIVTSLKIFDRLDLATRYRRAAEPETELAAQFLKSRDQLPVDVENFILAHRILPPRFVEADDILAMGLKPGKRVGDLLEQVYDAQLAGQVRNRGEALQFIKDLTAKGP